MRFSGYARIEREEARGAGSAALQKNSGDNSERDPPVPIPNTEVKPFSADGTWLETARESRTLPDPKRTHPQTGVLFFLTEKT